MAKYKKDGTLDRRYKNNKGCAGMLLMAVGVFTAIIYCLI